MHGGAAHDLGRRDLGIARFEVCLNGVERLLVDQRRNRDGDDLIGWLEGLGFAPLVELVAAAVGRPGQHPVNGADAPASAGARVELVLIQVLGDRLDAHSA